MVTMSNFPLQNREKRKILSVKFFVIFFLVIMFGVANTVFPNFFSGVFHSIGEPAWKAQDATATKILSSSKLLQSKKSLVEENIRLATQIEKMSNLVLEKDLLQEENKALKERFGRDTSENILLATVLARPSVSLYDTFVIDVGANDGVNCCPPSKAASSLKFNSLSPTACWKPVISACCATPCSVCPCEDLNSSNC